MIIVLFVNYSNIEFNKDFILSNTLINDGHTVFMFTKQNELNFVKQYDYIIKGVSYKKEIASQKDKLIVYNNSIEQVLSMIKE